MREAQHVEVGLVDRVDRLDHPFRDGGFQRRACQVITISSAKASQATASAIAAFDRTISRSGDLADAAPGREQEHQLPANGLKYQVCRADRGMFQSNQRAST